MKLLSIFIFLLLNVFSTDVGKINSHKKQAEAAYLSGNFAEAKKHYETLVNTLYVTEAEVLLNLAHTYFKTNDLEKASQQYGKLTGNADKHIRHAANNQLGLISAKQQKLKEALGFFKEALKADPSNESTRYNYELTKKLLEKEQEKKEQEKKDDKQEEQKKEEEQDPQQQENKDKSQEQQEQPKDGSKGQGDEGEPKKPQEEQGEPQQDKGKPEQKAGKQQMDPERMKEIKISPDRAQMILDAMKNQEVQYYQNLRRKKPQQNSTSKPDW